MKNIFKLFVLSFIVFSLSSCKISNYNLKDFSSRRFETRDNGYINFQKSENDILHIFVKYPDYCFNKQSGVIIDKNGKVFKKPDINYSSIDSSNLKLEIKDGRTFINSESQYFNNFRYQIVDENTIIDTLLDIKYEDYQSKYGIEADTNEYFNEFKELKELAKEYNQLVKDYIKYKDQLSPKVREGVEKILEEEKQEFDKN